MTEAGVGAIELMIVTAILGLLAVIAVPHFQAYRHSSRVAAAVNTADGIRAAFANYAVDSLNNTYPETAYITDWTSLRSITNSNGGTLEAALPDMGLESISYISDDGTTYTLHLTVAVPEGTPGRTVVIRPEGITRE